MSSTSDTATPAEEPASAETRPVSIWKNPDFVRLFGGRLVTNAGDSLYSVAMMWLVFELTGSAFYTGVASALLLLPYTLQFISGPLVDRWPLVRTLVATQLLQGAVVLTLPLAAFTGHLGVGLIFVTIPVLSLLNQFVRPAQSAALPRIVDDGQLTRSNSALSTISEGLDLLFEAAGGVLVAAVGAVSLFVLDSVTFLAAALLFVGITLAPSSDPDAQPGEPADDDPAEESADGDTTDDPAEESADETGGILATYVADLRTGVRALRGTVFVETILATSVSNFAVGVALAILPAFGAVRGGPALYGGMLGALGMGRLVGSLLAARLEHVGYGRVHVVGFPTAALLWLGAALVPHPPAMLVLFTLAWIPAGVAGVLGTTLFQRVVPDDLLGRVTSVSGAISLVTLPVGALVGGAVGSAIGPVATMALAAGGFGFVGCYYALRQPLRSLPSLVDLDPDDFDVGGK